MKLLAFDTSTEVMSIAVQNGDRIVTQDLAGGAQASATLIPAILLLMQQAGLGLRALDAIAFGRGPGSFTGLRTACSVAQGLAFGAGVQVLPIDTLAIVAHEAHQRSSATRICAALDARMGEMYLAYYTFDSCSRSVSLGYSLILPQNMPLEQGFTNTTLAGNVRAVYAAQLPAAVLAAPYVQCLPSASAMLRMAPQMMADGLLVDAQDALPLYVRDKVAQTTAERAALAAK
jgi:tRNA threonylcarbamoyladenosine biosynthesis protein TsaB